jgi:hypothetical protein
MGFMDKAKKLADQAQTKLDEVQKQFNENQASNPSQSSPPATEYDQHGRPVAKPADAAHPTATPQQGDPVTSAPPPPPADKTPHVAEETKPHGDPLADSSPKPPQPPSGGGMTSGDPLAG